FTDASWFEGTSWFQPAYAEGYGGAGLERGCHRVCCVWLFDVGDSENPLAYDCPAAHPRADSQTNRPGIDDGIRMAAAMRGSASDCRACRRAGARYGGKAMSRSWVARASRVLASSSSRSRTCFFSARRLLAKSN